MVDNQRNDRGATMTKGGGWQRGIPHPYKIEFQYPGQPAHTHSKPAFDIAERAAGSMAQLGATVVVTYAPKDATPATLFRLGPDQRHDVTVNAPRADVADPTFTCACGRQAATTEDIGDHLGRIGVCGYCWGGRTVLGAPDGILAGTETDCPVCDGSGRDEDMSYHDVELALYIPASQRLLDEAAGR